MQDRLRAPASSSQRRSRTWAQRCLAPRCALTHTSTPTAYRASSLAAAPLPCLTRCALTPVPTPSPCPLPPLSPVRRRPPVRSWWTWCAATATGSSARRWSRETLCSSTNCWTRWAGAACFVLPGTAVGCSVAVWVGMAGSWMRQHLEYGSIRLGGACLCGLRCRGSLSRCVLPARLPARLPAYRPAGAGPRLPAGHRPRSHEVLHLPKGEGGIGLLLCVALHCIVSSGGDWRGCSRVLVEVGGWWPPPWCWWACVETNKLCAPNCLHACLVPSCPPACLCLPAFRAG